MKTFVYHENPSGKYSFTKSGDAWAIDEDIKAFVVADSPLRSLTRDTEEYPYDDYGYQAASTFCNTFIKLCKETIDEEDFSMKNFKKILNLSLIHI